MQITMEALASALAPIEQVGHGEVTFDVGKIPVTLRVLVPEEETEVQRFAQQAFVGEAGKAGDNITAMDYLEKFKLAVLSYALVAAGDQDLRGVEFIETEEVLKNGQKVKLPRYLAMRQMVSKWSGPVRLAMFKKYTELLGRVEKQAEAAIEFEPSNIDAEIERLEKRMAQLKAEKERANKPVTETAFSQAAKGIAEIDETERINADDKVTATELAKAQDEAKAQEAPQAAAIPPVARQPIYPHQGMPPAGRQQTPASRPPEAPPPQAAPPSQVALPPEQAPLADVQDSFVDPSDKDEMDNAIASENRRLADARSRVGLGLPPAPEGSARSSVRRPPHMGAAEAAREVGGMAQAEFVGERDGLETYRLPAEEMTRRPVAPAPPASFNKPAPTDKTLNPRFRKPPQGT